MPGRFGVSWLCCLPVFLLIAPVGDAAFAQPILTTLAGGGPRNLPALTANIGSPVAVIAAPSGDLYVAALDLGRVLKISPAGVVTVAAGHGGSTICLLPYGDGGPAVNACLNQPRGLARDAGGNLYISDAGHYSIRRVDALSGIISTVANNSFSPGYSGDGGLATQAKLNQPAGIAFDAAGNLLIADRGNYVIRRVSAATGIITTVAGNGANNGMGINGPATSASLVSPIGVVAGPGGDLFIADMGSDRVLRLLATTGFLTVYAGNGIFGASGDGLPATEAGLAGPALLAFDTGGNLLIADTNDMRSPPLEEEFENHRVRRVDASTGIITTVVGQFGPGFLGDGGPADGAAVLKPTDVSVGAAGEIYIADRGNNRIRRIDAASGIITSVAGNGERWFSGDGSSSTNACLGTPTGLRADSTGNVFVSDPFNHRVRRVDAVTGVVTTIAGNGQDNSSGDGGPAIAAGLECPNGLDLDAGGNLFILDYCAGRVRRVDAATGNITTVAGQGTGYGGDGGPATLALFNLAEGIALDAAGNIFIGDGFNYRVRRVDAVTGIIATVAGTGFGLGTIDGPGGDPRDDLGDGGLATAAAISSDDIALAPNGDILISDARAFRIRRVAKATGIITTIAGNGSSMASGDGSAATMAGLARPNGIAVDGAGNIYSAPGSGSRVRRIDAVTRIITTVAGTNNEDQSPDGVLATAAPLNGPDRIDVDSAGDLLIAEYKGHRVRRISVQSPASGEVPDGTGGSQPLEVTRVPSGDLMLTWGSGCVTSDNDFAIYEGTLGSFTSHVPRFCSTSGGLAKTFTPAAGSTYYLVVPRNAVREGSYGRRSDESERPASAAACAVQTIAAVCQ